MRKMIFTVVGSALIAVSAVQMAAATEHHRTREGDRTQVTRERQFRNSNASWPAAVQPEWSTYQGGSGYGGVSNGALSAPAGR